MNLTNRKSILKCRSCETELHIILGNRALTYEIRCPGCDLLTLQFIGMEKEEVLDELQSREGLEV